MAADVIALPVCRGCGGRLDPVLADIGLHAMCYGPPEPMLPRLTDVLTRHQQGSQRSLQVHIGPSQIGHACDRHIAYRLFAESVPEPLKYAAWLGTYGHAGLAEAFAAENKRLGRERYLIETRVALPSETVPGGTCDLFDMDTGESVDWKFVGKTSLEKYRRHGPGDLYRIQGHVYGRGWRHAGYDVRSVRVVFLPRHSHLLSDAYEWSEPYDQALADAALARVDAIKEIADILSLADHPERYALVHSTPSDDCRFCPWHRQWPDDGPADATGCPGG